MGGIPSIVGNPIATGLGDAIQGYQQGLAAMYQRRIQAMQMQGEMMKNQAMAQYYGGRNNASMYGADARAGASIFNGDQKHDSSLLNMLSTGQMDPNSLSPADRAIVQGQYGVRLPQLPGAGNPQTPFDPSGNYVAPQTGQSPSNNTGQLPQTPQQGTPQTNMQYPTLGSLYSTNGGTTVVPDIAKTAAYPDGVPGWQNLPYTSGGNVQPIQNGQNGNSYMGPKSYAAIANTGAKTNLDNSLSTLDTAHTNTLNAGLPYIAPLDLSKIAVNNGLASSYPSIIQRNLGQANQANANASIAPSTIAKNNSVTGLNTVLAQVAPGKATAYENDLNAAANLAGVRGWQIQQMTPATIAHLSADDGFLAAHTQWFREDNPNTAAAARIYTSILAAKANAKLLNPNAPTTEYDRQLNNLQPVITALGSVKTPAPSPGKLNLHQFMP